LAVQRRSCDRRKPTRSRRPRRSNPVVGIDRSRHSSRGNVVPLSSQIAWLQTGARIAPTPDPLLESPRAWARRSRTYPLPGRVAATRTPSRHPSTSSTGASLGNPSAVCARRRAGRC
jgi:hypothetical protein